MERYCKSFRESSYSKNSITTSSSSTRNRNNNNNNNNNSGREPWSYDCSYFGGGDSISSSLIGGFSWPPRSYTCTFCKREFRSAQALGGHMNVHRRDRARLRESPPWDAAATSNSTFLNPDPSSTQQPIPNLNHVPDPVTDTAFSTPCPPAKVSQAATYTFSSLLSPITHFSPPPPPPSMASSNPLLSGSHDNPKPRKAIKPVFGVGEMEGEERERSHSLRRKSRIVRLDLEIGVYHGNDLENGDLDLELRLGCA